MLSHRDGSANDVRIALLGITDGAGLVEFLIADTNIGGTKLPVWKFGYLVVSSSLASLTPLLRGIVFIGKAAFRLCIDVGGVGPMGAAGAARHSLFLCRHIFFPPVAQQAHR